MCYYGILHYDPFGQPDKVAQEIYTSKSEAEAKCLELNAEEEFYNTGVKEKMSRYSHSYRVVRCDQEGNSC